MPTRTIFLVGPFLFFLRTCVGCGKALWRRPKLLTSPVLSAYHHECMERSQRAFALREQRDLALYPNTCNICGRVLA